MATVEEFDPDLLERIASEVEPGVTVYTLGQGRPNLIGRIGSSGIEVTTERSKSETGGPQLVPAWMFNDVWELLRSGEPVERDHVDRLALGRKVKRSSAVFAVLALLDGVTVVSERPLTLRLDERPETQLAGENESPGIVPAAAPESARRITSHEWQTSPMR